MESYRRLLPFPSSGDASSVEIPPMPGRRSLAPESLVPGAVPQVAGHQAAAIVSEAASILDEEMANGERAARDAKPFSRDRDADQSSQSSTLLRQVHDVIDNIAEIWPGVQGAAALWPGASVPGAGSRDHEPLPELKPASALRPGQRTAIPLTLSNEERHSVRLTPTSTDLLSSKGGRLSSQLVEFVPGEVLLEPGEQKEIRIEIAIPVESAAGCYAGLLVVAGVDYLRALLTIDVV